MDPFTLLVFSLFLSRRGRGGEPADGQELEQLMLPYLLLCMCGQGSASGTCAPASPVGATTPAPVGMPQPWPPASFQPAQTCWPTGTSCLPTASQSPGVTTAADVAVWRPRRGVPTGKG